MTPHPLLTTLLGLGLFAGGTLTASETQEAQEVLYEFESPEELSSWRIRNPAQDKMALSDQFATAGAFSMRLESPVWRPGMEEWPVWETKLTVTDWSPYDRMVIDLTNPSPVSALFRFKAADARLAGQSSADWPTGSETVAPYSHLRIVMSLDEWLGQSVNREEMTDFLFYTARPSAAYTVHVDNVRLLRPGEEPPALSENYLTELKALRIDDQALPAAKAAFEKIGAESSKLSGAPPALKEWAQKTTEAMRDRYQALLIPTQKESLSPVEIAELGEALDRFAHEAHKLLSLQKTRLADSAVDSTDSSSPGRGYAVGWASPMDKILPQEMPFEINTAPTASLDLARNEAESIQVVVVPFQSDLKNVRLEIGGFRGEGDAGGAELPAATLSSRVVGFVKTEPPSYPVDYVGWWPDPLLDFLSSIDIPTEQPHSFWVKVAPPKDQAPGIYRGEVRILAENAPPTTLQLTVRIRDFALPTRSPLPIATQDPGEVFFKPYSNEPWETLRFKVADFLADYYIDYDNIYRHGPPDFEILEHLRKKGKDGFFNLATINHTLFTAEMDDAGYQAALGKLIAEAQPGYDEAKANGMLKNAYFYGMDEVSPPSFPILRRLTADLKKQFPEVPIMTTAMDFTYGEASEADAVDIWVPIIHEYDPAKAAAAREKGKKVWWYTCQSPEHPYPNIFTEYPLIDIRLLMGYMVSKYQPDGFLYYCTFRDEGPPRSAVNQGPYTDWNARAFVQPFNGEGYLAYPGPNGRPLASIRLENFRDGLEDYAYWRILDAMVRQVEAGKTGGTAGAAWLKRAKAALPVPEALVKSSHEYSLNPAELYQYRSVIADLIESAPVPPAELHD